MEYPALDRLEALVHGLEAMQGDLNDRLTDISTTISEGVGDSGLVIVRARADGTLTDVHLDPRAMRMPSQDLANEFLQAASRAQAAAAGTTKDAVRTLLEPLPHDGHDGTGGHGR